MLSTLEKAGRVLRLFTAEDPEWGVSQVARELVMSKGSAHEALATLTQIGLVHRMVTGRYRLGFMVVSLHAVLMAQTPWRLVAQEEMERLALVVQQPVSLMAFDGGYAICIAVSRGTPLTPTTRIGSELPAHAAAAGKAVLAYRSAEEVQRVANAGLLALTPNTIVSHDELHSELARVRERGYALDIEEVQLGRCALAVPIRNANGEIIAALTVSAPAAAFARDRVHWLTELSRATDTISELLGHQPGEGQDRLHWHLINGEERLMRTPGSRRES
jgi:IclR family KDG regulon transcriptional repressor